MSATVVSCHQSLSDQDLKNESAHVDSLANVQTKKDNIDRDKAVDNILHNTILMMRYLEIPVRKNHVKDDPIQSFEAEMPPGTYSAFSSVPPTITIDSGNNRYYKHPTIYLSAFLDSILSGRIDTTNKSKIYFTSSIHHEVAHFLQQTYQKTYLAPRSMADQPAYISQPIEKEAHAVQAYYFLRWTDSLQLWTIMHSLNPMEKKRELLINAMYKSVFPWRKPIF